jgi:hypothetical protein
LPVGDERECQCDFGRWRDRGESADRVRAEYRAEKDETVKPKVKRALKSLVGYKFDVGYLVVMEFTKKIAKENGKDRDAARAKVIAANPGCSVKIMEFSRRRRSNCCVMPNLVRGI